MFRLWIRILLSWHVMIYFRRQIFTWIRWILLLHIWRVLLLNILWILLERIWYFGTIKLTLQLTVLLVKIATFSHRLLIFKLFDVCSELAIPCPVSHQLGVLILQLFFTRQLFTVSYDPDIIISHFLTWNLHDPFGWIESATGSRVSVLKEFRLALSIQFLQFSAPLFL